MTVPVPEGLAEDRKIRKDRVVVDDPEAAPMWPRYSELSDNPPFFATREGKKVYDLREVPAERRRGLLVVRYVGQQGAEKISRMASPPDGEKVTEPCGSDSPHAFFFGKRAVAVRFFITFAGPNRKPVQPDPVRTFFHF